MRHPGVDDDGVGRLVRTELKPSAAATVAYGHGARLSRGSCSQRGVDLDRGHAPGSADNLGEDRAVITGPGANMHNMCAIAQIEIFIHASPEARLPVV